MDETGQKAVDSTASETQSAAAEDRASFGQPGDLSVALGRIPSGLFVITWRNAAEDRGMLASWVMQAGFEPPSIIVAIGLSRGALGALDGGGAFVVNVLEESQRSMLARFGRPNGERFDPFGGLSVHRSPGGLAILDGAAAWLECAAHDRASSGDHRLIVATVACGGGADPEARPLVHIRKNGLRY
jgi:flavin reductase (DIM6/NTAB) family NADH-FMN oxidoreductase RutF